jgi:hypothetical protein
MKKAIFFFAFFLTVGLVSANAQCASAGKACCASKAAKAASSDASIEKRQAEDGSIAYVRKEADAQGSVKFVSVQYDEASNAFVNVAPKTAAAGATEGMAKKSCSPAEMKACSASEKKACAGGAAAGGKSCCAKPGAAATEKKAEQ